MQGVVENWVVYWNPSDYPNQYVVRRWEIGQGWLRPTDDVQAFDTLEEARLTVPDGAHWMWAQDYIDPCIVEVWM